MTIPMERELVHKLNISWKDAAEGVRQARKVHGQHASRSTLIAAAEQNLVSPRTTSTTNIPLAKNDSVLQLLQKGQIHTLSDIRVPLERLEF